MKGYEVRFVAPAVADLDALYAFIARKSSYEIADDYLGRIEQFCL